MADSAHAMPDDAVGSPPRDRRRSDGWIHLVIAFVLLAGLASIILSLLRLPAREDALVRLGLDRSLSHVRSSVVSAFMRISDDVLEEAAFIASKDSTLTEEDLFERWGPALRSRPAYVSFNLANELGEEFAVIDRGILVVRRNYDSLPGATRLVNACLGMEQVDSLWIRGVDDTLSDPRKDPWFTKALEERSGQPVWTLRENASRDQAIRMRASFLIRPGAADQPFKILSLAVSPERLLYSTTHPAPDPLYHAVVMLQDGTPLLRSEVDPAVVNKVHALARSAQKAGSTKRMLRTDDPSGRLHIQVVPVSIGGLSILVGAFARTNDLQAWTRPEWWWHIGALSVIVVLALLQIMVLFRRQQDIRQIRSLEKRTKAQERRLNKVLGERDVLDRETHHRVKNNLQVVSSLLNLQAQRIQEGPSRAEFMRSKQRIDLMAMVHHRLYGMTDLRGIDLQEFLSGLTSALAVMHRVDGNAVSHTLDTAGIKLDPDTAIDVGIIFCELVGNCFQHAFPLVTGGHIDVTVRRVEGDLHRMVVSDNGQGLSGRSLGTEGRLGIEVVEALAEKLDGSVTCHSNGGTTFEVRFRAKNAGTSGN